MRKQVHSVAVASLVAFIGAACSGQQEVKAEGREAETISTISGGQSNVSDVEVTHVDVVKQYGNNNYFGVVDLIVGIPTPQGQLRARCVRGQGQYTIGSTMFFQGGRCSTADDSGERPALVAETRFGDDSRVYVISNNYTSGLAVLLSADQPVRSVLFASAVPTPTSESDRLRYSVTGAGLNGGMAGTTTCEARVDWERQRILSVHTVKVEGIDGGC